MPTSTCIQAYVQKISPKTREPLPPSECLAVSAQVSSAFSPGSVFLLPKYKQPSHLLVCPTARANALPPLHTLNQLFFVEEQEYEARYSIWYQKNRVEAYTEGSCPTLPVKAPGKVQVSFRNLDPDVQPGEQLRYQVVITALTNDLYVPSVELISVIPGALLTPQRNRFRRGEGFLIPKNQCLVCDVVATIPEDYTETCIPLPVVKLFASRVEFYFHFSQPFLALSPPKYAVLEDEDLSGVSDLIPEVRVKATAASFRGQELLRTSPNEYPEYPLPAKYENQIRNKKAIKYMGDPWLRSTNSLRVTHIHESLYVEEAQQLQDLRRFSLAGVLLSYYSEGAIAELNSLLTQKECLLVVPVPGLSGQRPSVVRDDNILIWKNGTYEVVWEGRVLQTMDDSLVCLIDTSFPSEHPQISSFRFNVRFTQNRDLHRAFHWAVDKVNLDLICPSQMPPISANRKIISDVKDIELQTEVSLSRAQRQVVQKVVNFDYRGTPFLVLGPFGSGKSTTLVECVAQVLLNHPRSRILLCTQSNSAANVLVKMLTTAPMITSEILCRISARADRSSFDSRDDSEFLFKSTSDPARDRAELNQKRVIVSTCTHAGTLFNLGVTPFTHVMIDEAGQLFQPELLIPLCLATLETNVVLVGDFHQLAPRVFSGTARGLLKLDISALEELFKECGWYAPTNSHHERFIAQLTIQHRCPTRISEFPLRYFYEDFKTHFGSEVSDFCASVPRQVQQSLLPGVFHPVIFHSCAGAQEKQALSSSIFNSFEAQTLVRVVDSVIKASRGSISTSEIAIIAEQYQHRRVLMDLLREAAIRGVYVGSAASLQGGQFAYVFISTAVCNNGKNYIADRAERAVWQDYRKLNTAMTRASKLVYVIGDAATLRRDLYWNRFIAYCSANNSFFVESSRAPAKPVSPVSQPCSWHDGIASWPRVQQVMEVIREQRTQTSTFAKPNRSTKIAAFEIPLPPTTKVLPTKTLVPQEDAMEELGEDFQVTLSIRESR